ncbi:MAG: DUF5610 domain-containing protein [Pseudomonadota bacterium]|nr:DUF5610 domain-containing protein [Pseudomonadota bacterium]
MTINLTPSMFRQQSSPFDWTQRSSVAGQQSTAAKGVAGAEDASGVVRLGQRQSPEETAANILNHVRNGLSQLQAQGADNDRLLQRLEAAKAGIAKGYAEATGILDDMGMLDDDLQGSIADGRALVDQGIAELEQALLNPQSQSVAQSASLSASDSLSMTVMTRDGDRVQVSFAQNRASQWSSTENAFSMSSASSSGWQMQVNGNLSDAEREALAALFTDVQELSEQFFAGDIGAALGSAMELDISGTELASMSLNLTQKTVATATRAYSDVQPDLPTAELEAVKAPLAAYVDRYLNALDKASELADPQQAFRDLVQQMLPDNDRMQAWDLFHSGLNSHINAMA